MTKDNYIILKDSICTVIAPPDKMVSKTCFHLPVMPSRPVILARVFFLRVTKKLRPLGSERAKSVDEDARILGKILPTLFPRCAIRRRLNFARNSLPSCMFSQRRMLFMVVASRWCLAATLGTITQRGRRSREPIFHSSKKIPGTPQQQ